MSREGPACPRCGAAGPEQRGDTHHRCTSCRLIFDGNTLARRASKVSSPKSASTVRPVGWMVEGARAVPSSIEMLEAGTPAEVLRPLPGIEREIILRWRKTGGWLRQGGGKMKMIVLGPLVVAGTIAAMLDRTVALLVIILVGLALTLYAFIAAFVNATALRVSSDKLEVDHAPMPWMGNHRFTARDVAQVYCETVAPAKDGNDTSYRVMVILASKRHVALLPDLRDPAVALFIEEAVERTLGIQDQVVLGDNVLK